jgi:hypothetical protein
VHESLVGRLTSQGLGGLSPSRRSHTAPCSALQRECALCLGPGASVFVVRGVLLPKRLEGGIRHALREPRRRRLSSSSSPLLMPPAKNSVPVLKKPVLSG